MPEYPSHPDDRPEHQPSLDGAVSIDGIDAKSTVDSHSALEQPLQMVSAEYSMLQMSPLPPIAELEGMERILPGSFERQLTMMEQNAKTAREMTEQDAKAARENEAKLVDAYIEDLKSDRKESFRGLNYGLIITILGMVLSGFIAALGHPGYATVLGFAPLAILVSIFVVRKSGKSESTKDDDAPDN